jgi:hypothetical protein
MLTFGLSPNPQELQDFIIGQTFLMGKKRTMFQLIDVSNVVELFKGEDTAPIDECQPVQVKLDEVRNFREYEILAGTARYLLVRGQTSETPLVASFSSSTDELPGLRRVLPAFWVEQVRARLSA